jgi:DNA processing protein
MTVRCAATQGTGAGPGRACVACLRRSWLLHALSPSLDYSSRRDGRLFDLLALGDRELLQALGGRRRQELATQHARFDPRDMPLTADVETICRHDHHYPRALLSPAAPRMLHVAPSVERCLELTAKPIAALLGSRRATDYGIEIAKSIARGLSASGVTVASGLSDGIAHAAQLGALEADGGALLVMPGGADVPTPAKRRSLYERVRRRGCVVSELPCGSRARRWGTMANERLLATIATVTIVVEAEDSPRELAGAHIAQALGSAVAAVPGRVTSPASRGCHALLMEEATLVRGAADVLDLLYRTGVPTADLGDAGDAPGDELAPRLRSTLEQVGAGQDTPEKLLADRNDVGELLLALSELEVMGLLTRGDGGRYVPRQPLPSRAVRYREAGQMEP